MASNHSSPQHAAARCATMSSSLQETSNDVSQYGHVGGHLAGHVAESQYCAASSQPHCAECSRHCCVKQQVQVAHVASIINYWKNTTAKHMVVTYLLVGWVAQW